MPPESGRQNGPGSHERNAYGCPHMSDMKSLPTYIIAGAMRCGTTALNSYLRLHPEVVTSTSKEVHFFDDNFDRGLDWYRGHFPDTGGVTAIGEATPNYMFSTTALDRIQQTLPDVRLIVVLRNPIDRAYSHYWHDRVRGKISDEFGETAMKELSGDNPTLAYVRRGKYVGQLEDILERFPREALLVQIFEDMATRPGDFYAEVCRFIGVDDGFRPETLGTPVNSYMEFRSLALRRWSQRLPARVGDMVGRLNRKKLTSYPEMPDEVRSILADEFAIANAGLNKLIGTTPPWNPEEHATTDLISRQTDQVQPDSDA